MRGRPTLQNYEQLYKEDDIWQKNADYNNQYKVNYITYL